ncbi:glycosyltransferase family 2 protein [cf. Phormidesmis sp. LEGE 11477]|uniref:glycosyltransferase family 2 protein n=1 Tax=cf. Phormidesmis sp. LEGE 11477 TaxID=1828680 RepID=UPI001880D12F|nr:glycosyltransferase [cf. Phormidesmis sp. LEGE 11477]MBE9063098.1 glycosyltransferase [cf. Phormidesmis sp. LEGE 11477]
MFFSVVIPTYNRQPILEKCLRAMENQALRPDGPVEGYEIVLVDDGSTDGTVEWIQASSDEFPHVVLYEQDHEGAAIARNFGVQQAKGDTIIFIDSDLVVLDRFLQHHADALSAAYEKGNERVFTYGRVVNTCNFDHPTSEPFKVTDYSRAFFATGNVAIQKRWLLEAGLFDAQFTQYGWEDLELGVRLKNNGLSLIKCPEAVGYHWHPAFSVEELPELIDKEIQRARMGVVFYQKHPTLDVRLMIQMTWLHRLLWGTLSLGGALNERTLGPTLNWLIKRGYPQLSQELSRIFLNWYNVNAVYAAYREGGFNSAQPSSE